MAEFKPDPSFGFKGAELAVALSRMLYAGTTARKLQEIAKVLDEIESPEDLAVVERIRLALAELSLRAAKWGDRLAKAAAKAEQ